MEQHYITKLLLREHTYYYIFYIAQMPKTRASRLYRMKPMDCVLKVDMIPNSYLRGGLCGTPNLVELLNSTTY
jgi:hypothetical protein